MKTLVRLVVTVLLIPILFIAIFNIGELFTPNYNVSTAVYVTDSEQMSLTYVDRSDKNVTVKPITVVEDVNDKYTLTFSVPKSAKGIYTINFGTNVGSLRITSIAVKSAFRIRSIGAAELSLYFDKITNTTTTMVNASTGLMFLETETGNVTMQNTDPITEMATPLKTLLLPAAIAIVLAVIAGTLLMPVLAKLLKLKDKPKKKKNKEAIDYSDMQESVVEAKPQNPILGYIGMGIAGIAIIGIFLGGFPTLVTDASTLVREAPKTVLVPGEDTLSLKDQIAAAAEAKAAEALAEKEAQGIVEAQAQGYDDTVVYPMMTDSGADNERYNQPKVEFSELVENFTQENVTIGKTDDKGTTWYFYGDEKAEFGAENLKSDAQIKRMIKTFGNYAADLAKEGIKLYIVIGPNKSTIYPEMAPSSWNYSPFTVYDQVKNAFETKEELADIAFVDLRTALTEAKEIDFPLYYEYDTHWNNYGGFAAYTEIMKHISADFPLARVMKREDYQINMFESYMKDQLWYLGLYNSFESIGPVFTPLKISGTYLVDIRYNDFTGIFAHSYIYPDGFHDWNAYSKFANPALTEAGAPNAYVVRDSFSISLTYFLKDSFGKTIFDMSYGGLPSVKQLKSDGINVVIYEVAERSLNQMFS